MEMNNYTGQLSRLNQSLSLLFKIDNQQFSEAGEFNLSKLLEQQKQYITEQAEPRSLRVNFDINPDVKIRINPNLAEILVLNLIRNALFHNIENGLIDIYLDDKSMAIKNSGNELDIDRSSLFSEFSKGKKSRGLGLGLAICKKICNQYGMSLSYEGNDQNHSFIVRFKV